MPILFTFILSLIVTIALIPLLISVAIRAGVYDLPDARKVHSQPVPRIGGVAMALGALVPVLIYNVADTFAWAFLAGAVVIVTFGLLDDLFELNFKIKFAAQIGAALIVVLCGGIRITNLGSLLPDDMVLMEGVGIFLAVVAIVGVTNALNLADGLDGLAGGIALLMLLCIGYLAWIDEDMFIVLLSAALAGSIFGFLRYNTYPAVLFMGDTGSQLLGFSAVCLSLSLTQKNTALSPLLPLLILGWPILDTATVMVQRVAEGRSPFSPDRGHFHHRLMGLGLYHTEAVFVIYVFQSFLVASAYLFRFYSEELLLGIYLVFSGLVLAVFHKVEVSGRVIPRFFMIERVKERLRRLREQGMFIKIAFRSLEGVTFVLLILFALAPADIPLYFSLIAAAGGGVLVGVWFLYQKRTRWFLTFFLYFFIPFLIYLSDVRVGSWMMGMPEELYNLSFLLVAILSFLTLRFTRRKKGFKATPMDYLLIFLTLVLVALPGLREQFGLLGVKMILMFFACEIVLGEVRDKMGMPTLLTIFAFAVVAVRGI
ncbi:UDP-GlcNAc:undecaprenyl-phosphate GlcNAc-1-phosphate transferase [Syntrophus gentianae]|uniref:UDP-GlcNAc:undecaprenyl-phosphate GlcNAc-1-phosphate transferase n=1 Tax=Syntrophus gentianae TaxID=43775 RepID=A0A1H7X2R2_9BACT|nr:MraY family glycosyltransferase [Syntrophus gentianae]SEM27864.1 UDP-GlcNAc:undecaprenyl-phosphate GlcNAc-1-phosphate transferase [Syntrophus gentianae]